MLGYFPVPYPDELLYSVIARYKLHQGIISDSQIVNDLFGSRNVAAVVDFPGHLLDLEQKTYHLTHITADQWLTKHSLYPAYKYFLQADRNEKVVQSVLSGKAWDVHTRTGVAASNIKVPKFLRLCKYCYRDELELFGEPYWHRLHQLSGVMVCPIHKEYLYETDALFRPQGKYEFFPAINASLVRKIPSDFTTKQKQKLMLLSQHIDELINLDLDVSISFAQWAHYYQQLAENHSYLNKSRVNHSALANHLEAYWSASVMDILGLSLSDPQWLINLFRKHRKTFHYLCHLVVWQSLGSISPLSGITGAQQLIVPTQIPIAHEVTVDVVACKEKRREWKAAITAYPKKGVKWLRITGGFGALYAWLYRNDRLWLSQNTPCQAPRNTKQFVADWVRRDTEFLKHVKNLKKSGALRNNHGRSSMSWIIKQSGQRASLEKNPDKLPKTIDFIKKIAESPDAYRWRRIESVIHDLIKQHQSLEVWIIFRKAGIRKEYQTKAIIKNIHYLKRKLSLGTSRIIQEDT
ncbi:TnsD family Tn7-like transposition protein [Cellvibrio japonicus]|uniref:Tn7-Cj, transposition protein TnsD n=1 Tax=Cellvibrio japonicus (strain Ueda107) TaxID=498211 RepID=B3PIR6_CELJU|nr:TnsD family Tn7-like transposition protein [Cellvibrio japonicus]ACE83552.1 Tn7-Cj, transposition protein TnsD [Cellvibrio japonicus Ueda107]QEI13978.1 hypothetical protein FY117_18300 [Cellvibrio japonicus]QEI17552.1 hypothetical protein FY116_18305 [Cellvibrio japonicus]QEI21128.1 hypothetical protein FY115_18300 [Cellvibrio japonicus]